jgi:hypothetical protein
VEELDELPLAERESELDASDLTHRVELFDDEDDIEDLVEDSDLAEDSDLEEALPAERAPRGRRGRAAEEADDRPGRRQVPSWADAVNLVVSVNMAARERGGGRGGNRGGGRGRRRGPRRPS